MINNTFSEINSTGSTVISFGKYKPPASLPVGTVYEISTAAHDALFMNLQPVETLFQALRVLMTIRLCRMQFLYKFHYER